MTGITLQPTGSCLRFHVRVQPRASRNEAVGALNGALKVRLQAPPVDGAANAALIEFLSEALGVARRQVRIITGASSRSKLVEVEGVSGERIEALARR